MSNLIVLKPAIPPRLKFDKTCYNVCASNFNETTCIAFLSPSDATEVIYIRDGCPMWSGLDHPTTGYTVIKHIPFDKLQLVEV